MIDEAVVDFMQWVEDRAGERVIGKGGGKQPGKGETWVPKYGSIGDILDLYGAGDSEPDAPPIDAAEIDELIAEMERDAPVAF